MHSAGTVPPCPPLQRRGAVPSVVSLFALKILTHATFRQLIESRDAQFGALAGVAFAEGVVVREPVTRSGLLKHVP